MKSYAAISIVAIMLLGPAHASEAEAACKDGVSSESFDGVSAGELEAACECMAGEVAGNTALEQEVIDLSPLPMSERLANASPELADIAGACFPEAALQ